jgi:hypothetical protein
VIRVVRGVTGGLVGAALVAASLLVAYAFGAGYGGQGGVWLPTPLNVLGSLAVVWAAVHATYVLAVPRARRQPFTPVGRAVTACGALVVAAMAVAAALQS